MNTVWPILYYSLRYEPYEFLPDDIIRLGSRTHELWLSQFVLTVCLLQSGSLSPRQIGQAPFPQRGCDFGLQRGRSGEIDYMEFIAATMDRQKYVQEDVRELN